MAPAVLDAFADGALPPEEAARIVLHLADCPRDAAYVDAVMETNALLAMAYAAPLNEAVPDRIRTAIFPPPARPFNRLRAPRMSWVTAIAASCLVAFGASISGFWRAQGDAGAALLADALETSPSGLVEPDAPGMRITLIGTFHDRNRRPCREYEMLNAGAAVLTRGVACRAPDGGWITETTVSSRLPTGQDTRATGFVPAEGPDAISLDATLDRLGAGMALGPAEEIDMISKRWQP